MTDEKTIERCLNRYEKKMDEFLNLVKNGFNRINRPLDNECFNKFYSSVKYEVPLQTNCIPTGIVIDTVYKDYLTTKLLYPAEDGNHWSFTGDINPIPIFFDNLPESTDYYVDVRAIGNFNTFNGRKYNG